MFANKESSGQKRIVWRLCYSFAASAIALAGLVLPAAASERLPDEVKAALLNGDWAGVIARLEKSDVKDPHVVSRMVAGHACLAQNRNNEALILFLTAEKAEAEEWKAWTDALSKEHPNNAIVQYLHGDALARSGDFKGAEARFTQALEREAKLGLAWVARGVVKALTGRSDEAYLDLVRGTQAQPTLADAHASLGCLEVMFQNAEGAQEAFDEALSLNPAFALAYNGRGCARYGLGKPDEAYLDFEMAQTLCPALVVTEANQGFVLAMVARKVDEKVPAEKKPGTILETRMQTLVVDIPGICTEGAGRPEKWAPVLIGPGAGYERFNLRHEQVKGAANEPGRTIILPKNATPEVLQQVLKPVFDALNEGKSVYVKVDMPMNLMGYICPSALHKLRWAGHVSNQITGKARTLKGHDIQIFCISASAGTIVPLAGHMDLRPLNGLVFESPRHDPRRIENLADQNPNLKIMVVSANWDIPSHWGRDFLSINRRNVTVVNRIWPGSVRPHSDMRSQSLVSKLLQLGHSLAPVPGQHPNIALQNPEITAWPLIRMLNIHSDVQNPTLLGKFKVKRGGGPVRPYEGTHGTIAQYWLQHGSLPLQAVERPVAPVSRPFRGLVFESSQPWSQMPDLLRQVSAGAQGGRPVAIVAQDPLKAFAFERMLMNQGVNAVVAPPLNQERFREFTRAFQPSAVVGFPRDQDDVWRRLVPWLPGGDLDDIRRLPGGDLDDIRSRLVPWLPGGDLDDIRRRLVPPPGGGGGPPGPPPPGGGGPAAIARPLVPPTIQRNTFSFPDRGGRTINLPVPSSLNAPGASWDWGTRWTPPPTPTGPGGVKTELEWVFVDKGDWPVMTFFTLAYQPAEGSH